MRYRLEDTFIYKIQVILFFMIIVDPHVHCRDGSQSGKDTIGRASYHAGRSGVGLIMDMPNTNPALISRKLVEDRLNLARETCVRGVSYGLHVGLTSDSAQIREAVNCYNELSLREDGRVGVIGLKMFAGESVGDLAIIEGESQRKVYEGLSECGYEGVLVVHCEKESSMAPKFWNPECPISHSSARPARAEIDSVKDQVDFLYASNFKGTLHVAHVSTPEAVDYICDVRENMNMNITCGATPHHLFLNYEMQKRLEKDRQMIWKVNPPLRSEHEQEGLLYRLKDGKINYIETDHAHHKLSEKVGKPYMSGIPGLTSWPRVVDRLKREGFSDERIEELVAKNALKDYGLDESVVGDADVAEDSSIKDYEYGYKEAI
jgi:dihydroorotase